MAALGVNAAYVKQQPTSMEVQEGRALHNENFSIKGTDGADILKCDGKLASLSGRKEFLTPDGQLLFTFRKRKLAVRSTWYLENQAGEEFLTITKHLRSFKGAKLDIEFMNMLGGGGDVKLDLRGNIIDKAADIFWDGRPIANINRKMLNAREIFANSQTYNVQVEAGADIALIAALVVALDEAANDN